MTLEIAELRTGVAKIPRVFAEERARRWPNLLWLLPPLVMAFAVTRQSLWIDEGFTVWFASHDSFRSFLHSLIGRPGAPGDSLMLFFATYMWGWIKVFGHSEPALRAANLPFFLVMTGSAAWASRRLLNNSQLWVLFCLSPFVWFYLNEARPYAALLAFSTVSLVALMAYLLHPERYATWGPWCCLIALFLACGSHVMAAILIPSLAVIAWDTIRGDSRLRSAFGRDWRQPALCCLPAFVLLGGFFAWASSYGLGQIAGKPGALNLLVVTYEFLGFQGLGPPRNALRTGVETSLFRGYWPWLVLGLVAAGAVALALYRTRRPAMARSLCLGLAAGLTTGMAICWLANFSFWGRHLAVLFPPVLLTTVVWLADASPARPRPRTVAVGTLLLALAWGVSDARLVLVPAYQKDDYRDAASIAMQQADATGAQILWAADPHAARYYGVDVRKAAHATNEDEYEAEDAGAQEINLPIRAAATDVRDWTLAEIAGYLAEHAEPAVLVLSKADLVDRRQGWQTVIRQQQPQLITQLNSFRIYQLHDHSLSAARPANAPRPR